MASSNEFEQNKHQLVKKLVDRTWRIKDSKQKELEIELIARAILRSRPLCRQFNGMALEGVYREIYDEAKEKLQIHLNKYLAIDGIYFDPVDSIEQIQATYLYRLQIEIFKNILNDFQLKKMGVTAQNYSAGTELRSYALTELIKAIKLSGRLCRPHITKFSPDLYRTLYEEALAETFAYICLNIDLYDANRGNGKFMNWVNFILDKFILKCYQKAQKYAQYELPSLLDLERISQPAKTPNLGKIIQEYIAENPDSIFTAAHIRNRPDANFNRIALAKLSGKTWSQISQQLNIPIPTLSSFYNRWCRRFAPLFKTKLQQHL